MSQTATPIQPLTAAGADANQQVFLFQSLAAGMATATLALVKAVYPGGAGGSTVDVQPMVAQVDGAGNTVPHGVINGIPVYRLQGGGNAVILDPAVGDIGIAIFASRDISAVKSTRAPAPPGSARRFDMADGLYMGGVLNGAPTQYVEFASGGINIVSPGAVAITSATLTHNGVNIGATHVHGGVEPGGSNTAGPH